MNNDADFLREAIKLAHQSKTKGGYPFGAILVKDGKILHRAQDKTIQYADPTAHAELSAISEYCRQTKRIRLGGYALYTSTEPCVMCSGAIHWSHLTKVVYSVPQTELQRLSGGMPKPSCVGSINIGNRNVEIVGPLLLDEGLKVFENFNFDLKFQNFNLWFG